MPNPRYAPEFHVSIGAAPLPAALRASMTSLSYQAGLESADRVELTFANENLRWLDHPALALDKTLVLSLGYAPDPLKQMFVGEIIGQSPTFPSGGVPTLTVVAQDRRQRLQQGAKVRWFANPVRALGNYPVPDPAVASLVAAENGLVPAFEPIGTALAVLLGGAEVAAGLGDPGEMQRLIRKQVSESDFEFLTRIARENGWEMVIDHGGSLGGRLLRFISPVSRLTADVTLAYGRSLVDFTPRLTTVGQIAGVSVTVWRPEVKMEFTVTVSWDWDRQSLNLRITPGFGLPAEAGGTPDGLAASILQSGRRAAEKQPGRGDDIMAEAGRAALAARRRAEEQVETASDERMVTLVDQPVTLASAPRVILGTPIPRLNARLTGSGSTIGDPRIVPGVVLRLEGLGEQFGGLYRVTSATHTLNSGGYQTGFEVRKEIWFGSIPGYQQGQTRIPAARSTVN